MARPSRPPSHRQELQSRAIREILRATAEALPLDEILAVAVNMVIIVGDASTAWIMRLEGDRLRTVVARGAFAGRLLGVGRPESAVGTAAPELGAHPLVMPADRIDPSDPLLGPFAGRRESATLVPVRAAGRLIGLLGSASHAAAATDLAFLSTIAEQAATAIETALLREEGRTWRERLSVVFAGMAEAVLVYDRDGSVALMNPAAVDLFGAKGVKPGESLVEATGRVNPRYLDGRSVSPSETAAARALRGERVSDQEASVLASDGTRRFGLVSSAPLTMDGQTRGAVVVWRDVTNLRHAEEERSRLLDQVESERFWLRTVIDRSPVGIILVEGSHGERVIANRRAEEMFGRPLPQEGGIEQYLGQIYHPDGTPLSRSELATERALHGVPAVVEEEVLRQPSGREVRARVSSVPIRVPGRILGAVVILEDITEIRELEQQREEWTWIIAHDLRQPITIITGYADLLAKRLAGRGNPEEQRTIEHVLTSARNLNKMISDLLDISRISARQLVLERRTVDLPALVRGAVERAGSITGDRPVTVTVSSEIPPVNVDPARIEQVLDNLLVNAVKYGYPGTEIRIDVTRRLGEAIVSVTNHGDGIAPAELPRLFSRFYRTSEARAGRKEGLGLGLYISRGLIEAHGGRIWAESTPGQTTTFSLALPLPD